MTKPQHRVIQVMAQAPRKPAVGAPCNGCGLCCLAEPCPLGMVLSAKRHGACAALRWDDAQQRYQCGAIANPKEVLPVWLGWVSPVLSRLAHRWIAAGVGCDAHWEPD